MQIMAYPKTAATPIKIVSMMPNSRILHIKISFSKLEIISPKICFTFSCRSLHSHSGMTFVNAKSSSAIEEITYIGTYKMG